MPFLEFSRVCVFLHFEHFLPLCSFIKVFWDYIFKWVSGSQRLLHNMFNRKFHCFLTLAETQCPSNSSCTSSQPLSSWATSSLHLVSTGVLAVPDFCCLVLHCITLHDMTCCSLHFAALAVAQHVQTKTLNSSWLRELGRGFALMQHRWALGRPLSASLPPMRGMQLRPTGWRAKSAEDTSNQRLLRTTTTGFACLTGTWWRKLQWSASLG